MEGEDRVVRHSYYITRAFLERWGSCLLVLLVLIIVTLEPPYTNSPPIRSDGLGYHIWTRALLERDLSFCKYRATLLLIGALSREDPNRGVCQNKFSPGLALLRFPVMAFLVELTPGAPVISPAEHQANLILSALVLVGICLFCLKTSRLLHVRPCPMYCAVLALMFVDRSIPLRDIRRIFHPCLLSFRAYLTAFPWSTGAFDGRLLADVVVCGDCVFPHIDTPY